MMRCRRLTAAFRRLGIALLAGALLTPSIARADAPPVRLIDVVQITWAGAPSAHVTAADVANTITTDTIERWRKISNGGIEFTFDRILPSITAPKPMPCTAAGSVQFMSDSALLAYVKAGISNWDHRFLILVAPDPGNCVWVGRGVLNQPPSTSGILMLKDTADSMVIAHELGHNLGLGHSNLETCSGGKVDGPWADCNAIEYGSATDLMGNLDRTSVLSAYHQWRLGLLPDTSVALADRSKTVLLEPLDTNTGTRALFIRDGGAAYWVEYRRADPANSIGEGLVVYRTDPPPASSVVDPAGNGGNADSSPQPTTDVWMISLDGYSYDRVGASPSLRSGLSFTTAYGGVSIIPAVTASGALVSVVRKSAIAPAAPVWTPRSSWHGRDSQLTRSDLDDGGMAIDHFEARITSESETSRMRVPAIEVEAPARTYLAPVGPRVAVMATALPEGVYDLEVRAVNISGIAGAWSERAHIAIDGTAPTVSPQFSVQSANGLRTAIAWTGARDAGAGLCTVRAFDDEGFALLRWTSAKAGRPVLSSSAVGNGTYTTSVQDCFGNATRGTLDLTTVWRRPAAFSRTGVWSTGVNPTCVRGTCTATIRSGPGANALVVAAGSGMVLVDGRPFAAVSEASSSAPRVVARISGSHVVQVRTGNLRLIGVQSVRGTWTPLPVTAPAAAFEPDSTLSDDTQLRLSRIGFSQEDFADGVRVQPLQGGIDVGQPTLDLCSAHFPSEADRTERRQVTVTRAANDPYLFVSSETVRYSSSQAVRQALADLDAAASACQSRGYAIGEDGSQIAHEFSTLPALPVGLRPAADRRLYLITVGTGDQARSLLIAYQFRGRTLNALYVAKAGGASLDAATVSRWLRVAAVLAGRLTTRQ